MLPFQVGAIDPNRPGAANGTWRKRAVRVNRPYLSFAVCLLSILLLLILLALEPALAAKPKLKKDKKFLSASPSAAAGEQSLTNIPLPIGHEAKGLVLPDFDLEGHLRGRFEAGTAHRIDEEHVGFQQLKITTYTPENRTDLKIDMQPSVLDLKTRILTSQERTTIQRADFNIAGDSVEF